MSSLLLEKVTRLLRDHFKHMPTWYVREEGDQIRIGEEGTIQVQPYGGSPIGFEDLEALTMVLRVARTVWGRDISLQTHFFVASDQKGSEDAEVIRTKRYFLNGGRMVDAISIWNPTTYQESPLELKVWKYCRNCLVEHPLVEATTTGKVTKRYPKPHDLRKSQPHEN